jgi:PIN domain nuclease of toxin-antitoxin system
VGSSVLDASAVLAYLRDEEGAARVAEAVGDGAVMSAANWAEVLSKVADLGEDPEALEARLVGEGLLGSALEIVALESRDAAAIARLRPGTRAAGLSLGDRACLALACRLGLPALTADRAWKGLALGTEVEAIR